MKGSQTCYSECRYSFWEAQIVPRPWSVSHVNHTEQVSYFLMRVLYVIINNNQRFGFRPVYFQHSEFRLRVVGTD